MEETKGSQVDAELFELRAQISHLEREISRLANYIMSSVPGEPSQSQGACDTAIRIMRRKRGEVYILRDTLRRLEWCAEYQWGTGCYFCGELRSDGVHKESCRWKLVMGE